MAGSGRSSGFLASAQPRPSRPLAAAPPALPQRQVSSGERSAPAPRIRARPHEHARAATLARSSPTSKFIHKTLRLSQAQRRGSQRLFLPLLRVKSLVPTQNVRQHQFLPAAGGCDERGGRKGTDLGRRGGTARGEGGARRGAAWFLLPDSLSFGSVSKTRRGKLFLHLTPTLLKLPPPPCSRDWLLSHPLLPKSDNPDRLTGSGVNDNVYPEKS